VTLVGPGKPLDPRRLARVFVSPRQRAKKTFELLVQHSSNVVPAEKIETTEAIAEWNYGDYEGLKAEEIREKRKTKGLDSEREWNIWSDRCEGGESVAP
jgi:broad specificity phosphatase PhoE